jgi:hypothetical protein
MIMALKALGIIIDWLLEKAMKQALLVCPLSIIYNVIVSLVTFGADDFLDFIDAYFIEFAIMLFERTYLGGITDKFFFYIEEVIPNGINHFFRWLTYEGSDDDPGPSLFNVDECSESSGSDIKLSSNESM